MLEEMSPTDLIAHVSTLYSYITLFQTKPYSKYTDPANAKGIATFSPQQAT